MPKQVPYWSNFQVIALDVDGRHVKDYNSWQGAAREFREQIGHDPKNYARERFEAVSSDGHWSGEDWTLEAHVQKTGYFEVIDDWGRRITIQQTDRNIHAEEGT